MKRGAAADLRMPCWSAGKGSGKREAGNGGDDGVLGSTGTYASHVQVQVQVQAPSKAGTGRSVARLATGQWRRRKCLGNAAAGMFLFGSTLELL